MRDVSKSKVTELLLGGKAIRFYLSDNSSVGCYLAKDGKVHVTTTKPYDVTHWHEPIIEELMDLHEASDWICERDVEIE